MKKPTPVSLTTTLSCTGILLGLLLATSACQPAGAGTTTAPPTPASQSTIYRCGNINETCSKADFDKFEEQRKLAEQAEQVYRRYTTEKVALARAGGVTEPTQVLLDTTEGEFRLGTMNVLKLLKEKGTKSEGEVVISAVRVWQDAPPGAVIAIRLCEDARGMQTTDLGGKVVAHGSLVESTIAFGMYEGKLKAMDAFGQGAGSCAP